jgi:tyrosyl-tRNA synthetase
MTDVHNISRLNEVLDRGIVKQILPTREEFVAAMTSGKPKRMYIGADPTSNTLHLSHAKNYMLLEEFRMLGHEVIVLFGDFTAKIGDPTDRSSTRHGLSDDQIALNIRDWSRQIKPLMNFDDNINPPKILMNSQWLSKLSFEAVLSLASNMTVQRMLERDMFEDRINSHRPIFLHEFFYPLMQGYDSVAMDVDVELCGTDQIFNALVGRSLQKTYNEKDKYVVAVNLMENPLTGALMSKSNNTGVFLNFDAFNMYGAIMSLPDEMTRVILLNNTRLSTSEMEFILAKPPRDAKMDAAQKVTEIFYGSKQSLDAQEKFVSVVQQKKIPDDIPTVSINKENATAYTIVRTALPSSISNGEIHRLFAQGGVKISRKKISSRDEVIPTDADVFLQVGKRKWFKVVWM